MPKNKETETLSKKISNAEAETIRRVLNSLQKHELARREGGFNQFNFTVGVLNTLMFSWVFGAHPEHFWLLFLVEACALIPLKIYQDYHAKPYSHVFYYTDYCWIVNFLIVVGLIALLFCGERIGDDIRHHLYATVLGVGCGSLLGAAAILPFAAIVFHDSKVMTSLFIHLVPPMLLHTFMWHGDKIRDAWPGVFQVLPLQPGIARMWPAESSGWTAPFFLPWNGIGTVAGNSLLLYCGWSVIYIVWMSLAGLELTRTKQDPKTGETIKPTYDTVYFTMVLDGWTEFIGKLWGRSPEVSKRMAVDGSYEYRDFFMYMVGHACSIFLSINVLAAACMSSKHVHSALLWGLVVICVFRGASRYVYYVTNSSSHALHKEYRQILEQAEVKQS